MRHAVPRSLPLSLYFHDEPSRTHCTDATWDQPTNSWPGLASAVSSNGMFGKYGPVQGLPGMRKSFNRTRPASRGRLLVYNCAAGANPNSEARSSSMNGERSVAKVRRFSISCSQKATVAMPSPYDDVVPVQRST